MEPTMKVKNQARKVSAFMLCVFTVAVILPLLTLSTAATAADFLDGYKITRGDFNTDGKVDLFVSPGRRVIILPGDIDIPIAVQPVRDFVLQYNGNGTFTLIAQLTSAQRNSMSQWPIAAVDGWLRDADLDGNVDLELTGVASVISGAFDQVIYAPAGTVGSPTGLTAENDKFEHYHEQVFGWLRNHNYFADNAPRKITSAEPAQRGWYGSIRDRGNVYLMNLWLQQCSNQYSGSICALSDRPPPPPCVRSGTVYNDAGIPVGTGTNDICQFDMHVIIYIPQTITVAPDYSVFDADARETTDILNRLTATCPIFPTTDEERMKQISEQIWQHIFLPGAGANTSNEFSHTSVPGDELFNTLDKTYHHYDVYTKVCELTETNCNMSVVRDQALRHFSVPNVRLQPLFTPIPGPPVMAYISVPKLTSYSWSYVRKAGFVTQRFIETGRWAGGTQNVTEADHVVYPGTISRYIDTNSSSAKKPVTPPSGGTALYVFTHGVGLNRYHCNTNQNSRVLQMLLGYGNDVYGRKAFKQLDKEMIRWWRGNYSPNGVSDPPAPAESVNPGSGGGPIQ
jgi:hypothetical protein